MYRIFFLFLVFVGCSPNLNSEYTVKDDLGRVVHLPAKVERVAPLAPSITELLFASGAGSKVVGVSTVDDFPPAIDSLPRYNLIPMDFEAIVALNLDLIVATEQANTVKNADIFTSLGIPVYFVAINTLDEVSLAIRNLGELFGTLDIAEKRAVELQDSLAKLASLTANLTEKPSLLFLIEPTTLYAFGQGSYIHDMVNLAGGQSITKDFSIRFPILTDEFVLTSMPDVIVGSFDESPADSILLIHHPTWDIIPAIQSGRVYEVNSAFYFRPGSRLIRGVWELAEILNPDIIPGP